MGRPLALVMPYPPPKALNFSPIFCRHIQSRLSVPRLIHRPKRYPTVDCGMVDFLTRIAAPIRAQRHVSGRARNSLSFNFLRLATYLHLQRWIDGLTLGVPPNSHGIEDFDPCGCVWLTGHKEDGCFLSTTINMILPPSRRHC
jgi:hypothetical protein